jgi:DNA-binding transcriptional MerR regulator
VSELKMEVSDEIIFNFLIELKKKDVNPIDRAKIICAYAKEHRFTIRSLAKELGISHSTLQDWIDYEKLDKKEYAELLSKGLNKKDIHRILRKNRKYKDMNKITQNELNIRLEEAKSRLRDFINKPVYNEYTISLLADLRNIINRIEIHIEQKMKKGMR